MSWWWLTPLLLLLVPAGANEVGRLRSPIVYEISTRPYLYELSLKHGKAITLPSPELREELLALKRSYNLDVVWLMGVWSLGSYGREHDLRPEYREEELSELPDLTLDDIIGSPYAITNYTVNPSIGSDEDLRSLREFLHDRDMRLMLDFVPNHVAVDHEWACTRPDFFLRVEGSGADAPTSCMQDPASRFSIIPPQCTGAQAHRYFFGGDYWNAGWTDVLQLNYYNPALREEMAKNMLRVASMADFVRSDMAMSVLNDDYEQAWVKDTHNSSSCTTGRRGASRPEFRNPPAEEFWAEAIRLVRAAHPEVVLVAEQYDYKLLKNGEEEHKLLANLGFNYTYNIQVLQALEGAYFPLQDIVHQDMLDRRVHFVENHDDNRAAGPEELHTARRAVSGGVVAAMLPGMRLFNHGQFQCKRNRLGVHLRRSSEENTTAETVQLCEAIFAQLVSIARSEVVQEGVFNSHVETDSSGVLAWTWAHQRSALLVAVNLGNATARAGVKLAACAEATDIQPAPLLQSFPDSGEAREEQPPPPRRGVVVTLGPYEAQVFEIPSRCLAAASSPGAHLPAGGRALRSSLLI